MNRFPLLFLGLMFTFFTAWVGLVIAPLKQYGGLQPVTDPDNPSSTLPPPYSALAQRGREVYAANGCLYCHSQQVRPKDQGSDLDRGWGRRPTVARDYIYDRPVFLGTMRTGPDLINIGMRQPSAKWHHLHLYAPRAMSPGSIMPNFRHLYILQKIAGKGSPDALEFPPGKGPVIKPGYEIVPSEDARALVAYLLSMNHGYSLDEAPVD